MSQPIRDTRPDAWELDTLHSQEVEFSIEWNDGETYGYYLRERRRTSPDNGAPTVLCEIRFAESTVKNDHWKTYGTYTPQDGHIVTRVEPR